jgi:hypothetical protein
MYRIINTRNSCLFSLLNMWFASCFFLWWCGLTRAMASSFVRFLDHRRRGTTVGRTPLNAWLARRIDLYLTTQQTDIYVPAGIRIHNLSFRAATDLCLRARGDWDRRSISLNTEKECPRFQKVPTRSVKTIHVQVKSLIGDLVSTKTT